MNFRRESSCRVVRNLGLLLICLGVFLGSGWGQVETGSVSGTVKDSSGALVQGAGITVANVATGQSRAVSTNASGAYTISFLPVGSYVLTVRHAGFETFVRRGIVLAVAQNLQMDVTLKTGTVQQEVVVTGAPPVLQTDDATLNQQINHQQVDHLPLNGRNFLALASLSAGTSSAEPGARDGNNGGFSSNGSRSYDNNIMLDGVDDNSLSPDQRNGTDFMVAPPPDAVEEFKVETNGYGPEFGRGGGAAINVVTRSGTNRFHGVGWEFLRNNKLDARNFFDQTHGAPPFRQNQYGFTIGGPVVHDRTFFFGDYQGTRVRQSQSYVSTVPTALEKQGNFSDGFLGAINDPATGQPFQNQVVPANRMDPVALRLAQLFPDPNIAGTNQYASNPVWQLDTNQFDIRLDHQLSANTPIFGRLSWSRQRRHQPGSLPGAALGVLDDYTGTDMTNTAAGAAVGITHVFTSSVVNDLRAGYARLDINQLQFFNNENLSAQFGIPGIPYIPGLNGGLPQFNFSDIRHLGTSGCYPTVEVSNVYTFRDVLSIVHSQHDMRMGVEARPSEFTILQPCDGLGTFNYSGQFSNSGFADFLLGMPNNAALAKFQNIDYLRSNYAAFWGDNWRISDRLTLNYGLRWEYHTPVHEAYNAQGELGFDGTYRVSRAVSLPANFPFQVKQVGKYLTDPQYNDWAPRAGLAFRVNDRTVVRAAYGIFWQAEEIGTYSNPSPGFNPPFYIDAQFPAVSSTQPNPTVNVLGNGFPANALSAGFDPTAVGYVRVQPNFPDAYVQQWNLTVQREIGFGSSLEAAYVGSKGTHLINLAVGNQATPTTDPNAPIQPRRPIPVLQNGTADILGNGYSNYDGLAVTLRKRLSHGLSLNAAYTWSHALDIASSSNLGSANNGFFRDYNHQFLEYANSDFDVRHRVAVFYQYDLPFGRGRAMAGNPGRVVNAVIGGWQTYGIWTWQTGHFFTPVLSYDPSNSGSQNPRPDVTCNPNDGAPHTTTDWFNRSCFTQPALGTYGDAGRNIILGPGYFNSDMSLVKSFRLGTEDRKIEIRAEAFNIFNHPNFTRISDLTADDPNFGLIQSAAAPRQIQLAVKLYW